MANAHPFDDAEHANVPNSPIQERSSIFGSPNGSAPDLEGMSGCLTGKVEEKFEANLAE